MEPEIETRVSPIKYMFSIPTLHHKSLLCFHILKVQKFCVCLLKSKGQINNKYNNIWRKYALLVFFPLWKVQFCVFRTSKGKPKEKFTKWILTATMFASILPSWSDFACSALHHRPFNTWLGITQHMTHMWADDRHTSFPSETLGSCFLEQLLKAECSSYWGGMGAFPKPQKLIWVF